MASIFDIEERKSFSDSFFAFYNDIYNGFVIVKGKRKRLKEYLNYCFKYWHYREGKTSIWEYLESKGVDCEAVEAKQDKLMVMELFINLLYFMPIQTKADNPFDLMLDENSTVMRESNRLITNAEYILEKCCNMSVRAIECEMGVQYRISKRDFAVDSAVEAAPDLSDVLLGYYDMRNANDINYKESALTTLYKHLEPSRKAYRECPIKAVSEEFFRGLNEFGIRHNKTGQLSEEQKKLLYDNLFRIGIFILQAKEAYTIREELEALREAVINEA